MKHPSMLAIALTLASCGYGDSRMAHQAQINMVGMTLADLQSCAGVPDRASKVDDRTEVLTYVLKNDATGGLEMTLPIIGSGYKIGGGASNCNAHFRVVGGRVAGLFYSGNNDRPPGTDGVCAPIVRGCMRRAQASMVPLTRETEAQSSAYHQPPAPPPQPAEPEVVRMPTVGR
jgi:hypothetical protein